MSAYDCNWCGKDVMKGTYFYMLTRWEQLGEHDNSVMCSECAEKRLEK